MDETHQAVMLKQIVENTISGSTELALKVMEFYSSCSGCTKEFMQISRDTISAAHTGLGLVRNCNSILYGKWENDPIAIGRECDLLRKEIKEQIDRSVLNSRDVITDGASVVTLSNSSAVRSALILNRRKLDRVFVLESRPGLEGLSTALELERNNMDVTLLVDSAVQEAARRCSIALCGSDSVLSDGSLIHKVGTYPLFLAMQKIGRKTYSMTIGMKREDKHTAADYPEFVRHDPAEFAPKGQKAINIYFDTTPASLISGYITGRGIQRPQDFCKV